SARRSTSRGRSGRCLCRRRRRLFRDRLMKIAAVLAGLTLIVVVGVAAWVSRDSDPTPPTDALAAETAEGTADSGRAPRVIAAAGGSVGDTYAVDARDGLAVF